jgi:2-polyprenyl-3-methyl-5-hydroxy-6-metoxy-1,4-benzoquinol methylase
MSSSARTDCMLCGSKTRLLLSAKDYIRPDSTLYDLNWCNRCDFGRLAGNFTAEQVLTFYPKHYYTHANQFEPQGNVGFLHRLRTHLAWRCDRGQPLMPSELPRYQTICDIGCGDGSNLDQFRAAGYETMGIEPDAEARNHASKHGAVLAGTAECLPGSVTGRKFDVILMSHVLEHCIEPTTAVANAAQLVDRDGRLVIEVPNNAAQGFQSFSDLWPWTDIPRHLNFFTQRSLRSVVEAAGFRVETICYVGYARQFLPSWISTQYEIWRRTRSGPPPNFETKAWLHLFETAFAADELKYDSLRIVAMQK